MIPHSKEIKLFLEKKRFADMFVFRLNEALKEQKTILTFDFESFTFKDEIVCELLEKEYTVQHMKFKEMYMIAWK